MSAKKPIVWEAEPHTIAKIEILRSYLYQWFSILGTAPKFMGKDLWYIDGFSGPGEYTNYPQGSPLAALAAAKSAMEDAAGRWVAKEIHCVFIEDKRARFDHLRRKLNEAVTGNRVHRHEFHGNFVDGLNWLKKEERNPFASNNPVFAFIDPFGPSGLSFQAVKDLLSRPACEVLINLDSDGVSRIHQAGDNANHRQLLNDVFGDADWEHDLAGTQQAQAVRKVLALYKQKLRSLPDVNYAFSFEMRKKSSVFDYHLVFASQHPKGLQKMKEVMKRIDQSGTYCFSDDHVGQQTLFTFDDPSPHARQLQRHFAGTTATYAQVNDYALNESPFPNPKSMLKFLERDGQISVESRRPRNRGTYAEDAQVGMLIRFGSKVTDG